MVEAFKKLPVISGRQSTIYPDMDFETYSEAGFVWIDDLRKWKGVAKNTSGLSAVGVSVYAEHPSTEILSMAYNLKNGSGPKLWLPGMAPPDDLLNYISSGGFIEAWNWFFEYKIWNEVGRRMFGWPEIEPRQFQDAMAKARAYSLPGALGKCASVIDAPTQKLEEGKSLIRKLTVPRSPTKNNPSLRVAPTDDVESFLKFYEYNLGDIKAESAVSALIPDLNDFEERVFDVDKQINARGVQIDVELLDAMLHIIDDYSAQKTKELKELTGGEVSSASEVQKLLAWLNTNGIVAGSLASDHLPKLIEQATQLGNKAAVKVLQIRESLGSASVKKAPTVKRNLSKTGRLYDLFSYCKAGTGRWAGRVAQPQNLPSGGPSLRKCDEVSGCGKFYRLDRDECPYCGNPEWASKVVGWSPEAVDQAAELMALVQDSDVVSDYLGDPLKVISGCLRGLFIAKEGHELLSSDFSAIEAVVLAMVSGELWRINVFMTHGMIYEESASKITGVPFEEFVNHKKETGEHHPLRKSIGKVAELACFGPDTQVLTKRGYMRIVDVTKSDFLWDGVEWVQSLGAIKKKAKQTINVDGVKVTENHPISLKHSWKEAKELVLNEDILRRALEIGSENLPLLQMRSITGETKDQSLNCNRESSNLNDVYDIVNAGPRNRFTIKTKSGHLIVHNSGYQGGVGAWKNFGADKYFEDDEAINDAKKKWRDESPNIVNFWYGIERAAISAVQNPGQEFKYNSITYYTTPGVLHCLLPSGRTIQYHKAILKPDVTPWGREILKLTYEGWNSDSTKGPVGWFRFDTYGGKLTENIVQAIARDIQADRLVALEEAGFPIVLHVHDEIVAECPIGEKSIEEFERIMSTMPDWCSDWPVKASGGWVGKRFRKD